MYLKHILSLDENETIRMIYEKQKTESTKGDWLQLIEADLKFIGEQVDKESIKAKSKNEYKKWVNNKLRKAAFNALGLVLQPFHPLLLL